MIMVDRVSVFIIAEAGVNHNGSVERAFEMIDCALAAGADAVKFQTFRAKNLVTRSATKAAYQTRNLGSDESQFEMIQKLQLDDQAHKVIAERCAKKGIQFLSSPFDLESLAFLVHDLNMGVVKIPSGEITNAPLLLAASRMGKSIILSTGMSTLEDVAMALGVLAFGYSNSDEPPSLEVFQRAYQSPDSRQIVGERVTLLQCTTDYPVSFGEINLRVMETLRRTFEVSVGLSDHSRGMEVPIAAVAMGAAMVEKHFTLDRNLPGPDHKASLEPSELKAMIHSIRNVEQALGSSAKTPTASELQNLPIVRKSLVASCAIKKGEPFTSINLTSKRPGNGISPMHYWNWLGKAADRDYAPDELIGP